MIVDVARRFRSASTPLNWSRPLPELDRGLVLRRLDRDVSSEREKKPNPIGWSRCQKQLQICRNVGRVTRFYAALQ